MDSTLLAFCWTIFCFCLTLVALSRNGDKHSVDALTKVISDITKHLK